MLLAKKWWVLLCWKRKNLTLTLPIPWLTISPFFFLTLCQTEECTSLFLLFYISIKNASDGGVWWYEDEKETATPPNYGAVKSKISHSMLCKVAKKLVALCGLLLDSQIQLWSLANLKLVSPASEYGVLEHSALH